jgi:general secretion pathway protein H
MRCASRGFSLLEILVVMTIVAVLAGTIVLGFTGADAERNLRGIAERIAIRVEHARQYALQRNTEWGVYVDPDSYRFFEFDPAQRAWVEQDYRPFRPGEADLDSVSFHVKTERLDVERFGDKDLPKIILFSSGEATPFEWSVQPDWDSQPWIVESDGLGPATASRP